MSQRIIIVGSSSGIGRRMAEIYLSRGFRIGITGRRSFLLDELKEKYPEQVETACFDITQDENIAKLNLLVTRLGGMDLLVISAGTGDLSEDLSWAVDKATVDTNVKGFIEIANWAYNYFSAQGHGHLAVISSIAAVRGNAHAPAYSASKAFQSIYFEGLSLHSQKLRKPVSVTCIEPGFVKTKMAKGNKQFWVVPLDKAVRQIIRGLDKKKRKVYISRRWQIIAAIMKWMPYWLYRRIV